MSSSTQIPKWQRTSLPTSGQSVPLEGPRLDLGKTLTYELLKRELENLEPRVRFDVGERRPSDYSYAFSGAADHIGLRTGIYYNGRYICAVDRGIIPEFKVWEEEEGWEPIPMSEIEKHDQARVCYIEILPKDPFYHQALTKAEKGDDNYQIDDDGRVFRYEALREGKTRGRVIRLGWRHTLNAIVRAKIPTLSKEVLEAKFGVDLGKYPVGEPELVNAALFEE